MTNEIQLRTPAKIYAGGWVGVELVITDDNLIIGKQKISFGEIEDLEEVIIDGNKCIQIKLNGKVIFHISQYFHQQVFRYIVSHLKGDKFVIYMMLSATVGGAVSTNTQWEKGYFTVTNEALWFLSKTNQVRIAIVNLGYIKKDIKYVEENMRKVLVLSYVENKNLVTSFILCPESTLEMIGNYINFLLETLNPEVILSKIEEQVLTLLYSGVDFASIEKITGISIDELNIYYDRFVDSGLAKVVKIRKEIELTPRGIIRVDQISLL
jgi:taxis protein CheF